MRRQRERSPGPLLGEEFDTPPQSADKPGNQIDVLVIGHTTQQMFYKVLRL